MPVCLYIVRAIVAGYYCTIYMWISYAKITTEYLNIPNGKELHKMENVDFPSYVTKHETKSKIIY